MNQDPPQTPGVRDVYEQAREAAKKRREEFRRSFHDQAAADSVAAAEQPAPFPTLSLDQWRALWMWLRFAAPGRHKVEWDWRQHTVEASRKELCDAILMNMPDGMRDAIVKGLL